MVYLAYQVYCRYKSLMKLVRNEPLWRRRRSMIRLGFDNNSKIDTIRTYCESHGIKKVYILSPSRFRFEYPDSDQIEYADIIMYKVFYRLLQEINKDSLLVINECLRTQNRNDLTYNCIRNYLNQTPHQIVFQYLPFIDTFDDFMPLLDWDTKSKWKREKFRPDMMSEIDIKMLDKAPIFKSIQIDTSDKAKEDYQKKKNTLIDGIGLKDPHTIPRNLLLMTGKWKLPRIAKGRSYVGRNDRFGISGMHCYKDEKEYPPECTVFEFCHNFIDFSSFMTISRQIEFECLVTDLKVDQWYFDRYCQWSGRIKDAYAAIQQ